ncbi:MAG TPA: FmdB family zinc ribbon protein [Thermoanaerobaculia bacterium]|nr:FmdB family zinc ribbon protein [Thermoanaerobaculia bacterium]
MPLYEYQCVNCSERVEILQRIADPLYSHCPKCGGEMKKLLSAPAIQFKGSGFYKTDYASKSEAKSESKSEGTKSETKSDSSSTSTTPKKSE